MSNAPQFIGEIDADYDNPFYRYQAQQMGGLGKFSLKKTLKKVAKPLKKIAKVAVAGAALYYGGGALIKAAKGSKLAKGAKMVKGVAKKSRKGSSASDILNSVGKFTRKHKKAIGGAALVGAAVAASGGGDDRQPASMVTYDDGTGAKQVDFNQLNPAAQDRFKMQNGIPTAGQMAADYGSPSATPTPISPTQAALNQQAISQGYNPQTGEPLNQGQTDPDMIMGMPKNTVLIGGAVILGVILMSRRGKSRG